MPLWVLVLVFKIKLMQHGHDFRGTLDTGSRDANLPGCSQTVQSFLPSRRPNALPDSFEQVIPKHFTVVLLQLETNLALRSGFRILRITLSDAQELLDSLFV